MHPSVEIVSHFARTPVRLVVTAALVLLLVHLGFPLGGPSADRTERGNRFRGQTATNSPDRVPEEVGERAERLASSGIPPADPAEGPPHPSADDESVVARGIVSYDQRLVTRLSTRAPGTVWSVEKQWGD